MQASVSRWGLPIFLALLVMLGYQVLVAPTIGDWLADWQFLHAARQQAIQQARKPSQP